MKAYIEPYSPEMEEEMLNLHLRDSDVAEVYASSQLSAKQALMQSLKISQKAFAIKYGNKIIGAIGVAVHPDCEDVGIPWMLGSDDLNNISFTIVKWTKAIIKEHFFFDNIKVLTNFVSAYHEDATKWLRWSGFTLLDNEVFLQDQITPFIQFVMWREEEEKDNV